jgi:transposase-like protein
LTGKRSLALKKLVPLLLLNIGGPMALCVLIADTKRPITWPNAEFMNVVNADIRLILLQVPLFHSTNVPLVKWFWAIYLTASDKEGISATRLAKQIGVSWLTARRMLQKIRTAMGRRDSIYRLTDLIEVDDTYVGGKKYGGKRGRGAAGKKPVLVAVESRGGKAGFMAMEAVSTISGQTVKKFLARRLRQGQTVCTDAFPALNTVGETQNHLKKVTPAKEAMNWLPWVHIIIGNLKKFLNGTYHGVSSVYLQEYLDEFCYRFNRRFWEFELPYRLLNACLTHVPVKLPVNC